MRRNHSHFLALCTGPVPLKKLHWIFLFYSKIYRLNSHFLLFQSKKNYAKVQGILHHKTWIREVESRSHIHTFPLEAGVGSPLLYKNAPSKSMTLLLPPRSTIPAPPWLTTTPWITYCTTTQEREKQTQQVMCPIKRKVSDLCMKESACRSPSRHGKHPHDIWQTFHL